MSEWRITARPGDDVREDFERLAEAIGTSPSHLAKQLIRDAARRHRAGLHVGVGGAPAAPQAPPADGPVAEERLSSHQLLEALAKLVTQQPLPSHHPPVAHQAPGASVAASQAPPGAPAAAPQAPAKDSTSTSGSLSFGEREPELRSRSRPLSADERLRLLEIAHAGAFGGRRLTPTQAAILRTAAHHRRAIGEQVPVVLRFLGLDPGPPGGRGGGREEPGESGEDPGVAKTLREIEARRAERERARASRRETA